MKGLQFFIFLFFTLYTIYINVSITIASRIVASLFNRISSCVYSSKPKDIIVCKLCLVHDTK
ncbi:hypothetical protein V1478_009612 [Vespula squamosa]|uniref:Uncharacterized protein n=1 Tax=Vespula squamosa TaxID=30214 RepID=A0ABD2AQ56_VESSQ